MRHRHPFVFISSLATLVFASCLQAASAPSSSPSAPSPPPSAPSPSTTIAATSATPTTKPVAGRPSPRPVPGVRSSDLVVRHEGVGDTCCPVPWAVLTADGRYITRADDTQLRERKLTAAGVQRVRDEIAATGRSSATKYSRSNLAPARPRLHTASAPCSSGRGATRGSSRCKRRWIKA